MVEQEDFDTADKVARVEVNVGAIGTVGGDHSDAKMTISKIMAEQLKKWAFKLEDDGSYPPNRIMADIYEPEEVKLSLKPLGCSGYSSGADNIHNNSDVPFVIANGMDEAMAVMGYTGEYDGYPRYDTLTGQFQQSSNGMFYFIPAYAEHTSMRAPIPIMLVTGQQQETPTLEHPTLRHDTNDELVYHTLEEIDRPDSKPVSTDRQKFRYNRKTGRMESSSHNKTGTRNKPKKKRGGRKR